MNSSIKEGDRVSAEYERADPFRIEKIKGTFLQISSQGFAVIDTANGRLGVVPSSMRKIRIVKKVARRKRWINCYPGREDVYDSLAKAKIEARPGIMNRIEMIEVRKKK